VTSAKLLLHPIRLRIVQAFLGDRALTMNQLASEIDDVPIGTLYRHVAMLTKAGVLQVVAERRVRAVIERTYMLRQAAAQIQPEEAAAMTPDQHLQAFIAYVGSMLAEAERYLTTDSPDPLNDGFGYRIAALWLTDAEYAAFLQDLAAVFRPRLANAPAKNRHLRTIYTVLLPHIQVGDKKPTKKHPPRTSRRARTSGAR